MRHHGEEAVHRTKEPVRQPDGDAGRCAVEVEQHDLRAAVGPRTHERERRRRVAQQDAHGQRPEAVLKQQARGELA